MKLDSRCIEISIRLFVYTILDLKKKSPMIQFEGFCRFIDQGLMEELSKFPKIEDPDQETEFQFFVETYQLVEPLIKERDAVYESLTYSSELYVPARLIWKTGRNSQEQTILIGNIPIMVCIKNPRFSGGTALKKGQILADGVATVGGELALGKNILVAYIQ